MRIPRSVTRGVGRIQAVHLHVFADASNTACSAAIIAVVEGETGVVKGLLTSKSSLKTKHIHSETRVGERTDGSKHGQKPAQRT